MEQIKITLNIDIHSKLELLSEIITSLRKDMLAMEEELRAFKTRQMIKDKLNEDALRKELNSAKERNATYPPYFSSSSPFKVGTEIAYTITPKPNETYTDLEKKPRRAWHH